MDIILENVRSFCNEHSIPLRPLTFLVGENSTGKTSFLAMLAQVHQSEFPSTRPGFNIPPFDLGTFDSIATYKGGRYGRADNFSLGFVDTRGAHVRKVKATYGNFKGQPQLTKVSASNGNGSISIDIDAESHVAKMRYSAKGSEAGELNIDLRHLMANDADLPAEFVVRAAYMDQVNRGSKRVLQGTPPSDFIELAMLLRGHKRPVFALAPVRTKPRRTYDQFTDDFDPEGDHVPVVLAQVGQDEDDTEGPRIVEALDEFGKMSGLFGQISVRHLGRKPTDPFQLLVTMGGPPANLSDVGYGVSQTLPIIVQSLLAAPHGLLLLQQPEVHLHPRAQAALGSFFAQLIAKEKKELVIETHSDYLLDRVRVEVARGTVRASDVLILFFEKEYIETSVHKIELDEHGNVVGAPESYRQFFLEEETALFSRAKS
jgi:hypothetical protein